MDAATCDGSSECKAVRHLHGCYSDDGTNCDHPSEHGDAAREHDLTALRQKVEARLPGVQKILTDMRDSGDPDRLADAAFLLGTLDEISDYVDALREVAGV